ncbi:hypothetical protein [Helicobacter trogontum]|uniref:Uncharacterized protein n=1 Tax=Helicobacter trogontum TaxID=50960 RepID=A0ABQ0D4J2_9HELI|nr:hypothetical protein [Helicobacter trogontum]MCI5787632.1 hypothetical protein [Helicobacter trogontum]MDY5185242.1 hypothetical protein [Helicobacter trogontum]
MTLEELETIGDKMFDAIKDFMKVIKTENLKKIKKAVEIFPITQAQ